jgi:hypothetical protein
MITAQQVVACDEAIFQRLLTLSIARLVAH